MASRWRAGEPCSSCCAPGGAKSATVHVSSSVRDDPVIDEIRERAGSALKVVDRRPASIELARSDAPQGVVATAAPLRAADLDELLRRARRLPGRPRRRERSAQSRRGRPRRRDRRRDRSRAPEPSQCAHHARVAKAAAGAIEYLPIALTGGIPTALERARTSRVLDASASTKTATRSRCSISSSPTNRSCWCSAPKGRGLARLTRRSLRRDSCRFRCAAQSRRSTWPRRPRSPVTRSAAAAGQHVRSLKLARAGLAQLVEQLSCKQQVVGSIPTPGSISLIERLQSGMLVFRPHSGQDRALWTLTDAERSLLDFEREWWQLPASKMSEIRARFGFSSSSYYRSLHR